MIKKLVVLLTAVMVAILIVPMAAYAAAKSPLTTDETNNIIMTGIVYDDLYGRYSFESLAFGISHKYPKTATNQGGDAASNLITSKYTYDEKGRFSSISYEWEPIVDPIEGFDEGYIVQFEYDEAGHCEKFITLNAATGEEAYSQKQTYLSDHWSKEELPYAFIYEFVQDTGATICAVKYDSLNRISDIKEMNTYGGDFHEVQKSYHFTYKNGFLTKVTKDVYGSKEEIKITYSKNGLPVQFSLSTDGKTTETNKVSYDGSGRATQLKGDYLNINYAY